MLRSSLLAFWTTSCLIAFSHISTLGQRVTITIVYPSYLFVNYKDINLVKNLTVAQFAKKPLVLYGNRRFCPVLKTAGHFPHFWSQLTQCIHSHLISLRSILTPSPQFQDSPPILAYVFQVILFFRISDHILHSSLFSHYGAIRMVILITKIIDKW